MGSPLKLDQATCCVSLVLSLGLARTLRFELTSWFSCRAGDTPPPGIYKIWVENNEVRNDDPTPFTVRLTKDGKSEEITFEDAEEFEEYACFEFEVGA